MIIIFFFFLFGFPQQDKPVINKTASSQDVPVWKGTTANLSCVADGNPAPRYTWTNSSGLVASSEESGILQVTPLDPNGFGPYTCTVENNKGKDSYDIRLVKVGMSNWELNQEFCNIQGKDNFCLPFVQINLRAQLSEGLIMLSNGWIIIYWIKSQQNFLCCILQWITICLMEDSSIGYHHSAFEQLGPGEGETLSLRYQGNEQNSLSKTQIYFICQCRFLNLLLCVCNLTCIH